MLHHAVNYQRFLKEKSILKNYSTNNTTRMHILFPKGQSFLIAVCMIINLIIIRSVIINEGQILFTILKKRVSWLDFATDIKGKQVECNRKPREGWVRN